MDGWAGFKAEESWRAGGGKSKGGVGKACGKSRHTHIKYNWYVYFMMADFLFGFGAYFAIFFATNPLSFRIMEGLLSPHTVKK